MHINDRPLLVYIRNRLGLGKIYPISIESILPEKDKLTSVWEVFYKYPLNTTKQLDYLALRKPIFYILIIKKES